MALNERDVRRLAWEFADKIETENNTHLLMGKEDLVKEFANTMRKVLFPDKSLWNTVPKRP